MGQDKKKVLLNTIPKGFLEKVPFHKKRIEWETVGYWAGMLSSRPCLLPGAMAG